MPAPRCPICDTPLVPAADGAVSHAPFCSARCKLVDLSKWLSEDYRVPGPALGDGGPLGGPGATQDDSELQ